MAEEQITLEQSFEKLEEMIKKLESREISLEDSFVIYQKAMGLLKQCNEQIDTVEKKMMIMNENGELHEF